MPSADWTGWRGPRRDGRVPWLPSRLPKDLKFLWRKSLRERGLGGVAATRKCVIVSDRELRDRADAFRCLDAESGNEIWNLVAPAIGKLDFGNSPRATPLIEGDLVYLAGAFGQIHCVKVGSGEIVWERDLAADFPCQAELPWGMCGSPLMVDGKLILNPGAKDASLVVLDAKTGQTIWKSPGAAPSYGSFIAGRFGGRNQIVGHDADSLGGWDVASGKRLWRLVPAVPKEFGVPTPVAVGQSLLVSTENNGTRIYRFAAGRPHRSGPLGNQCGARTGVQYAGSRGPARFRSLEPADLPGSVERAQTALERRARRISQLRQSHRIGRSIARGRSRWRGFIDRRPGRSFPPAGLDASFSRRPRCVFAPRSGRHALFIRGSVEIVCLELPAD